MDFYIKLDARAANEFSIKATGRDQAICGNLQEHLILNTYREVLQAAGRKITPLAIRIDNDIPIGKGCGSSAAARLAGIAMAVHFGRLRWTDSQIVGEASRREHHPDNASACWMGGLTVARMSGEAEAQVASVRPKGKWPLLLAVPEQSLSTEEARRVLPSEYSRADAVTNVQNSMLLLAAFMQGRPRLPGCRSRGPYSPAVPCASLPFASVSSRTEGTGWSSGGSSEWRGTVSADVSRSAGAHAESAKTGRRPTSCEIGLPPK